MRKEADLPMINCFGWYDEFSEKFLVFLGTRTGDDYGKKYIFRVIETSDKYIIVTFDGIGKHIIPLEMVKIPNADSWLFAHHNELEFKEVVTPSH